MANVTFDEALAQLHGWSAELSALRELAARQQQRLTQYEQAFRSLSRCSTLRCRSCKALVQTMLDMAEDNADGS